LPEYRRLYHPLVLSRDILRLDPPVRERVKVAIERKLTEHPEASAKPLAHTTRRLWSLRVGDRRVIFALRETEIWILKIGHRRDV
jgi:mRNA-degrading endonuclease RelE of RelBE toxin-antitoxin system